MVLKKADSDNVKWTYSRYDITGDKAWGSTIKGKEQDNVTTIFSWVYWDQLDANCLVLFYYTLFHSTCFGCNIHPSSGASYNAHAV